MFAFVCVYTMCSNMKTMIVLYFGCICVCVCSTRKTKDLVLTMMGTLHQGHMSTVAHLASKGPLELPGLQRPHQVGASPSLLVYGVLPSGTAIQTGASL